MKLNQWICGMVAMGFAAACSKPATETTAPTPGPAVAQTTPTPKPVPTPHPAEAAKAAALLMYPDLAKPGSTFNQMFVDFYNAKAKNSPESLTLPDWPITFANQVAEALNVRPVAAAARHGTPGPTPTWFEQKQAEKSSMNAAHDQAKGGKKGKK